MLQDEFYKYCHLIRTFLTKNSIVNALELIDKLVYELANEEIEESYLTISARYSKWKSDEITMSKNDNIEYNKIILSIAKLLNTIKQNYNEKNSILTTVSNSRQVTVKVIIDGDFNSYTDKNKSELKEDFANVLGIQKNQVEILMVVKGSIILHIKIPEVSYLDFLLLYKKKDAVLFSFREKHAIEIIIQSSLFIHTFSSNFYIDSRYKYSILSFYPTINNNVFKMLQLVDIIIFAGCYNIIINLKYLQDVEMNFIEGLFKISNKIQENGRFAIVCNSDTDIFITLNKMNLNLQKGINVFVSMTNAISYIKNEDVFVNEAILK